jgi:acyl-CoA reductase-like NAD-dependent aldehyde dehydrogenase
MATAPRTLVVDDPFTGEPACTVALADDALVGATLDRARDAARAWRETPLADRASLCERATAGE